MLIFAAVNRWLLQQREPEDSFVLIIFVMVMMSVVVDEV